MAQYCEIAGKITNCTDDCHKCLEEERREGTEESDNEEEKFTDFS